MQEVHLLVRVDKIRITEKDRVEGAKKRQVSLACSNCRTSKTACNDERPCRRCIRKGISNTCVDAAKKKRVGKTSPARQGNVPILPNTPIMIKEQEYIEPLFKPPDAPCPQIFEPPNTPNLPYLPEENNYNNTNNTGDLLGPTEPPDPDLLPLSPSTFEDLWSSFVSEVIEKDKNQ